MVPLPPTAEVTSFACPFQVEGIMPDGQAFYFRSRHGSATFDVGATLDDAVMGNGPISLGPVACSAGDDDSSRLVLLALYDQARGA